MNRTIRIPNTDLELSSIGLGTLGAGVKWDGADADAIFDAYLALGGNLIDTARVYQDWIPGEVGRSERVVGDWLRRSGKRNSIVLMTKGGHPKYTGPQDDLHIPRMTPADMRGDLEKSLKALCTDHIDIYLYHRDNLGQSIEEEIETMETFRREGKLRWYGCSNWTAARMREADAYCAGRGYRGLVADQAFLNLGMKHMNPLSDDTLAYIDGDILDYHKTTPSNLAMAYYSSANGFFHRWLKDPDAQDETYRTPGNLRLAERLKKLMEKRNASMSQVLLGYLLTRDYPCLALYGPSSVARLTDAMGTTEIPFEKNDFEEVLA